MPYYPTAFFSLRDMMGFGLDVVMNDRQETRPKRCCNLREAKIGGGMMGLFNQIGKVIQDSAKAYISLDSQGQRIILTPKAVTLLCQQAVQRVEVLENLEPAPEEGLIATIVQKGITARVRFTPEQIVLKQEVIEGQLRLLGRPEFEADSWVYRALLGSWSSFLGGYIPNQVLPEGVRLEKDRVFYTLPKSQLRLVEALFSRLEAGSALDLSLQQGSLAIQSKVSLSWKDLNLSSLLQVLNIRPPGGAGNR
jgi:hypothetical protein